MQYLEGFVAFLPRRFKPVEKTTSTNCGTKSIQRPAPRRRALSQPFHIQLINVHDLKQSIKAHDRRVQFETAANKGQLAEDTIAEHERLFEEFQSLDSTIKNLREEFGDFIHRTS
jgi:hypothetical protein